MQFLSFFISFPQNPAKKHYWLLIAIWIISFQHSIAQDLQSILEDELGDQMSGISVTVKSGDDSFAWSGAAGWADISTKEILHSEQTFRIASVTKTYVAASVLRLMEMGTLSLDDPISQHISQEHGLILSQDYDLNQITIRHILRHSAGLFDHTHAPEFFDTILKEPGHHWTRTEQFQLGVDKGEPIGPPGKQFSYSDTGYLILGELVEKYTGKNLDTGIKELLKLEELGLERTDFEGVDPITDSLRIHQYFQGMDTYNFSPTMDYYGGGGFLSTTEELVDFFQDLFQDKVFDNHETLETMLEPVSYETKSQMDYQMGMYRVKIGKLDAYCHSGFWGTQVIFIPEKDLYIAANYSSGWKGGPVAPVFEKLVKELEK